MHSVLAEQIKDRKTFLVASLVSWRKNENGVVVRLTFSWI